MGQLLGYSLQTKMRLHLLTILSCFVQYANSQCPTNEWKIRGESCYLFKMNNYEDESNWNEALGLCKARNASLVTIHNSDENQYVYTTMLQETVPTTRTNAWTGMYKQDFGFPYVWENGEDVVYTNWAPGEPNDQDGSQNCVRMYGQFGDWDDYFCQNSRDDNFIRHGYICKIKLDAASVIPRYEIGISGNFTSTTGADFTNLCTLAYAESMNTRASSMRNTVNSLIGSGLCKDLTPEQMTVDAVSAPLLTSGNTGSTSMFYIAAVSSDLLFTQVEICSQEISDYLSVHSNWDPDGEVLPPEEGCPGVQFTEDTFSKSGNQWLCPGSSSQSDNIAKLTNTLKYRMTHNGVFQSVDGSNISSSCLSSYSAQFTMDTISLGRDVNQMIGDTLCVGSQITFNTIAASLVLTDTQQGVSIQLYELDGPESSFDGIHSCMYEVSLYLSDHNNWESLLPPVQNCPDLSFTNSFFSLGETRWICV